MKDDYEVVATVNNGILAAQAVSLFNPDIVVLDIAMPGTDGFETARRIRELALPTRIVFLTITEDWDYVLAASKLGASYVLKRRIYSDLLPAVNETLAGRLFVSPMPSANPHGSGSRHL
jgi:DNA-binding NarL/FixJ family response regulator